MDRSQGSRTYILEDNYKTTLAHQKAQEQILEMAISALKGTPIEKRDQSSMMMATRMDKVPQAKKMIRNFRRRLCDFLEEGDGKDTVFQLGVSLFPLVQISDQKQQKLSLIEEKT